MSWYEITASFMTSFMIVMFIVFGEFIVDAQSTTVFGVPAALFKKQTGLLTFKVRNHGSVLITLAVIVGMSLWFLLWTYFFSVAGLSKLSGISFAVPGLFITLIGTFCTFPVNALIG